MVVDFVQGDGGFVEIDFCIMVEYDIQNYFDIGGVQCFNCIVKFIQGVIWVVGVVWIQCELC